MTDDLTISIGNLGSYELLAGCLRSIYQHPPDLRFTVCVVYNPPEELVTYTDQRIEREFPQVRLIRRKGPLGYCLTHNLVLRECRSRYVLVLDDDTLVPEGTLSKMVRFMDEHPDVGMAGCRTLNHDGSFQRTFGLVPSLGSELVNVFRADSFWPDSLYENVCRVREVQWLNGSFMLVRGAALDQVGMLDEHYYTYVCEPDWCYRMTRAGWKVVYVPDAEIVHVGGEHSVNNKMRATNRLNLVRYHVNRFYFFHKHYGLAASLLLRPIMITGSALRALRYFALYLMEPGMRGVASVRLRVFADVIRLSLSPRPYKLPRWLPWPPAPR
jgi:GT2 family glycosyltransferase